MDRMHIVTQYSRKSKLGSDDGDIQESRGRWQAELLTILICGRVHEDERRHAVLVDDTGIDVRVITRPTYHGAVRQRQYSDMRDKLRAQQTRVAIYIYI